MNTKTRLQIQNSNWKVKGHSFSKTLQDSYQKARRALHLKLAASSAGRVTLHVVLALLTSRYAWHFHGIVRELARN